MTNPPVPSRPLYQHASTQKGKIPLDKEKFLSTSSSSVQALLLIKETYILDMTYPRSLRSPGSAAHIQLTTKTIQRVYEIVTGTTPISNTCIESYTLHM